MNPLAWFVAGWISAGVFIALGVWLSDLWEQRQLRAQELPPVYSPEELERAVQRRQGLR
jgi:hypothetical protein